MAGGQQQFMAGGQHGWQQHCWQQHGWQQPMQVIVPQHTGVKALYGTQQIVVQHLLVQHLLQQLWQQNQAGAWPAVEARPAALRNARAMSFFMACDGSREFGANGPGILMRPAARPCS